MNPPVTWRTFRARHVSLQAPDGSQAARRAPIELREAEQAIAGLEKLLSPPADRRAVPVQIFLLDPVMFADAAQSDAGSEALTRVFQPDAPAMPVVWPLAERLLAHGAGPGAARSPLLVNGVAGVVAARAGQGRSLSQCREWVQAELDAGRRVSPLASLKPASDGDGLAEDPAATSFSAFLIDTHGLPSLRRFLAAFDPARPDQAAIAVYQQPLGVLEQAWRASLQKSGGQAALRAFGRQIWPLLRPYWAREVEIVAYMLFGLAVTLALPLSTKYVTDHVYSSHAPRADRLRLLFEIATVLLLVYVANGLVTMRRAYVTSWVNQRVLMSLRERLFAHLQRLSHNFYAEAKVGDVMSRLMNDLGTVQQAVVQVTDTGIYQILVAVGAAIALLRLDWRLGLLVLLIVPIFGISFYALQSRFRAASREQQKRVGETTTSVQENLSAQATVKAFGLAQRAQDSYHVRLLAQLNASLRVIVISVVANLSVTLAVSIAQIIVLGVGGWLVVDGQISLGTLFAFTGLLMALLGPVAGLSGVGQSLQMATGSMDRVSELLEEPVAVDDKADAVPLGPLSQEIRLEHIVFGYGGDRPILNDLDLTIPAGANVAFVGPSGCGKSTTLNLLMRFWDPEAGRVLFDGQDLRDVTLESLRGQIGLVFQETFIFDTTVRENIAIGRPNSTEDEIIAAAKAAQLDSYIQSLPSGYDTVLGERGARMSGGQRQRLAIARVMLRDPRILILDEATSALDAQTEAEILHTLSQLARGRTTISITHRLSWAASADCIYVLDKGRLTEQGPHAELVQAGGLYQRLYQEQTGFASGDTPRAREDAQALRTLPLFAALAGPELAALGEKFRPERFPAGTAIVRQGEPGDKLYLIRQGQVDVVAGEGDEARRINTLGAGDCFGEMALLEGAPRAATVRATETTQTFSLARADFLALLERNPPLRAALTETAGTRRAALAAALAAPAGS